MSATGRKRRASARMGGFTLLETLVMAGVMALIAMLVVPNMVRALDILSLHQTVRLMEADLRVARATALRTGQKVDVTVSNGGREYDWIGGSRYMPPGVTLAMSNPYVVYPDGSTRAAAISLTSKGRTFAIYIDPITGAMAVNRK